MCPPQTSYPLDVTAALAGQVVHRGGAAGGMRGRYEPSEDLSPGRIAELHTDGALRLPQTAGASGKLLGGIPYTADMPPGGYKSTANGGWTVPIMRKGQMWVEYTGTAPTVEAPCNVSSSSTIATNRGKVTGSATSTTAGSEVYALDGAVCVKVDTTLGLALIEFNLPA